MKLFSLLKIQLFLVGLGALLLFSPTCKAQSEVSPDHFDGTDTWEVAARKPVAAKIKATTVTESYQAQNMKAGSQASLQLASVRDSSNTSPSKAVAVQDKRKVAVVRKPNKE
jgi:hypothetical protein